MKKVLLRRITGSSVRLVGAMISGFLVLSGLIDAETMEGLKSILAQALAGQIDSPDKIIGAVGAFALAGWTVWKNLHQTKALAEAAAAPPHDPFAGQQSSSS